MKLKLFLPLATLALSQTAFSASFDCEKARTLIEKTICSNQELSNLDDSLMLAYKEARKNSETPDDIKHAQRAWLKSKRNLCQTAECLIQVHKERILELQQVTNSTPLVKKQQNTSTNLQTENISVLELSNTKNIQARIETKSQTNADIAKILEKSVKQFMSKESLKEMLSIKIKDTTVLEDEAKAGEVPISISYSIGFDYKIYLAKILALEQVFENLGAVFHKRVDIPYHIPKSSSPDGLHSKNRAKLEKMKPPSICILKKYAQGYKTDFWEFPSSLLDSYPFNVYYSKRIEKLFNIILEIKSDSSVLVSNDITKTINPLGYQNGQTSTEIMQSIYQENRYLYGWRDSGLPCLSFFLGGRHESLNKTIKVLVPTNIVGDIKNISIELENTNLSEPQHAIEQAEIEPQHAIEQAETEPQHAIKQADVAKKTATDKQCTQLYYHGMYNKILEKLCDFNGGVGEKIMSTYKQGDCDNLISPKAKNYIVDNLVVFDMREKYTTKEEFCDRSMDDYKAWSE